MDKRFRTIHGSALRFTVCPNLVFCVRDVQLHCLKLAPVADLAHLSKKKHEHHPKVILPGENVVYVSPMPAPKTAEHTQWPAGSSLLPFWWVNAPSQRDDANMEWHVEEVEGIHIECLRNSKVLKPGMQLFVLKSSKTPAIPLQGATLVESKKQRKG